MPLKRFWTVSRRFDGMNVVTWWMVIYGSYAWSCMSVTLCHGNVLYITGPFVMDQYVLPTLDVFNKLLNKQSICLIWFAMSLMRRHYIGSGVVRKIADIDLLSKHQYCHRYRWHMTINYRDTTWILSFNWRTVAKIYLCWIINNCNRPQ